VDEPGYQGGEGAELIAARPDPGRLGPARLACGKLAEVVASVPVAIRSREPHGGDRAEPDGTRALQARLECCGENQVPAPAGTAAAPAHSSRRGRAPGRISPRAVLRHRSPGSGPSRRSPRPGWRARHPPRCSRFAAPPVPGGTPPATACPVPSRSVPQQPGRRAGGPPHESRWPRILQATGSRPRDRRPPNTRLPPLRNPWRCISSRLGVLPADKGGGPSIPGGGSCTSLSRHVLLQSSWRRRCSTLQTSMQNLIRQIIVRVMRRLPAPPSLLSISPYTSSSTKLGAKEIRMGTGRRNRT
jgi:hypothetical protein